MSLFDLLVVAHLVGDWMFQTNWMAKSKRGRPRSAACLGHCLVYTATLAVALWSVTVMGLVRLSPVQGIGAMAFIFLTHWLIDGFALPQRWSRWINRTDKEFVLVVIDQTMHLVTLALLAWWLVAAGRV